MKRRRTWLAACIAVALIAPACGGGDDDTGGAASTTAAAPSGTETTVAPAPSETSAPSDDAPAPAAKEVGADGSFTVDGEVFAVTTLNRCIPFSDAPGNIDLQALSQGAPSAKLNLVLEGDFLDLSVDGSGINELFGSRAFGDDPVVASNDLAGDRWTGSATVADSLGSGTTVDLTWDIRVPDEVRDCSL